MTTTSPAIVTAVDDPALNTFRIYPNPTTESVIVDFTLSTAGAANISLVNPLGQRIQTLPEPVLRAGQYTRTISLRGLSAGRYTITVETPSGLQSRVVLIR
ncbi:MAG: T9SS type A sorting domain-containing protein [Cytophagaceae bacterium]|nr:MAG: T9SS type A sorting domain-containing protein [Cytophagaceae bacterium]